MFLAPLMHRFGWRATTSTALGAGTLVGHLLECGMQVTGGYFADPGVKDVPDLAHCGFPIAEVAADGGAVITKLPETGGRVSLATVKEQLLYEVHDPARLSDAGRHRRFQRRRVEPRRRPTACTYRTQRAARGRSSLKVTVGFDGGFLAEAGVSYAGPGAAGTRGRLAAEIVRERLRDVHGITADLRVDLIGVSSLFATAGRSHSDSRGRPPARRASTVEPRARPRLMLWEVELLLCCGPAGGGGFRGSITPGVMTKSVLIGARWSGHAWRCSSHEQSAAYNRRVSCATSPMRAPATRAIRPT